MFGEILDIFENRIVVLNKSKQIESNLLNIHVVFSDGIKKIIGEIIKVTKEEFHIILLGEIKNESFESGISKLPSLNSSCRIIYKSELEHLIGSQDVGSKSTLLIGESNNYDGYKITTKVNDFFSSHFAIIGNTGTGKSCGVARILQNIFYYNNEAIPRHAHIVLFDVYGEYHAALAKMKQVPGINVKSYTTETESSSNELLNIPPYFLNVDDLAILLDMNDSSLIPILEKTLQYVCIFTSTNPQMNEYKNDIISKCLLDILSSGTTPSQIRDQIISILTKYHTDELNLESEISEPGYKRSVRQCLLIDGQGKINAIQQLVDFFSSFTRVDLNDEFLGDNFVYSLDDLYNALEFALLSEGTFTNHFIFEKANCLKIRLHAIMNSEMKKYFTCNEPISKEEFIQNLFLTESGEEAQIVNMNFNYIDDRFTKILTKIYSHFFFDYLTNLKKRGSFPIHIILEEAHRYVTSDKDIEVIGYNIFDRITKEGRKYGLLMGFITQRPSELSKSALSQCSNFIVFRLFHPEDLKIVESISSNITGKDLEKIKTLKPGNALTFGSSFAIPMISKLEMPDPAPNSSSIKVTELWFKD